MSVKAQKASGLEHVECKGRKDDAREKRGSDRCQLKRTRGHLPNPNVLDGESKLLTFRTTRTCSASVDTPGTCMPTPTNKRRMEMVQTASSQITVAIRFEQITERSRMSYITSLDLESIRMHYPIPSTSIRTTKCPSKSHPVKKSIQVLDLSSLCQLKKLSVRGCSSLRILRIPSCLEGLDSSACSALKEITFSVENLGDYSSGQGLCVKAMNLNGCRSLTRIQFFEDAVRNVTELDMTSVSSMPKALIAQVLKRAEVLKNVSLRYIATDDIITALAASKAAHCLCLVDISFSSVTDGPVESLVNRAMQLERCNLRGNKNISGECYNQVPIHLSRRNGSTESMEDFSVLKDGADDERKRRKGDNIFFFVNNK